MEGSNASKFVLGFVVLLSLAGQLVESKDSIASALYVFGDSTIDAGNNNQLNTISKANFPPYGRDFPDHKATGRFTNGKLSTDIISELSGLPDLLPASLDPNFQGEKLLTGACFGSASSGYDDSTSQTLNVLTLGKQLENFRYYRLQLANMTGKENASKIISEAMFALSTGSNDFVNNYYTNPLMAEKYSLTQFEDILLQSLHGFVKSIFNEGASRLVIVGLPPFGCCPSQITLKNVLNGSCYEKYNEVAASFNEKTIALIKEMTQSFPALRIAYYDIYGKLYDIIKNPTKYGFEETRRGCCGSGLLEASILCNEGTPTCSFVKSIFNEGASRLVIVGLPPFGCCPSQITLKNVLNGSCYEKYNEVAASFNEKTIALIKEMTQSFPALRIAYYDIYGKLYDIIKNPTKYGFEETRRGCCGSGLLEASILCNEGTPTCSDPSKYVFWDSFHPTSEAYNIIAKDLFSNVLM